MFNGASPWKASNLTNTITIDLRESFKLYILSKLATLTLRLVAVSSREIIEIVAYKISFSL